jgi:predicted phosphoribosyltransferase
MASAWRPGAFGDRRAAGRELAELASGRIGRGALVLALPRGGVPVGFELARGLDLELDVLVVRKLGVPGRRELALGAIASGGLRVLNEAIVRALELGADALAEIVAEEAAELARRERLYRGDRPAPRVAGREVALVDDGIATGASMRVAIEVVRLREPARVVVATPVVSEDAAELLRPLVDDLIALAIPRRFVAVGSWYEDFSEIRDDDVRRLLDPATAAWGSRIPRDADYNPTS